MSSRLVMRAAVAAASMLALLAPARPGAAQQQRGAVQGVVRAANTERPLVGAQVFIPGTSLGTLTDNAGRYSIASVQPGAVTLRVEMLGFSVSERTVQVAAGATVTADFALSESAVALDEIVVTGTAGQARKREIGNAVSSIASQQIESAPVTSVQDVISGRATGVTVMMNSGQPGSGATIRLRGNNSVSQGNNPLIYVDGVRIFSDFAPTAWASRQGSLPLNDIDADDIDRVEIVKGAAATTLYGTEASGGVIQIFTKKGSAGRPIWNAELSGGVNNLGHIGPDDDPTGFFLKQCRGANLYAIDHATGRQLPFEDPTCPSDGSWSQNGVVQRYSLSVRGGAPELTYFLSGNYNDEEGAIPTGWSKSGGFRGNFSFRPRTNLEFALSTSYVRRNTRWVPDGNNASGLLLNVARGPFNNFKNSGACATQGLEACVVNGEILKQENYNHQDHFVTGLTVQHNPGGRVSNRLTLGWDYNNADNQTQYPFGFLRTPLGLMFAQNWNHTTLSVDYVGSLRADFGRTLTSSFSWGGQVFEDRDRRTYVDAYDLAGPGEPTLESFARKEVDTDRRLRVVTGGIFLQEVLGWKDRLFLTAGLRVDGNSAFGSEFGLQPYPKVSASYVLSEHGFWPGHWWETLKLRGAVGESGKAPGAFDAVRTWEPISGDEAQPGFTPAQVGNPELGPERSREIEAGFESSMFNGRLGLDVTAYWQRTIDALIPVRLPPTQGFEQRQLMNVGELKNNGLEVRVDAGLLQSRVIDWRARANYTSSRSETVDVGGQRISVGLDNWVVEGFPVPGFFGARVTNPDEIADPVVQSDQYHGPAYPTRILSLGTTLTLLNRLTVDALAEHQGGHFQQNWVGYQNARRGIWFPCYDAQQKLVAAKAGDRGALSGLTAMQRARCAIDRTIMNDEFWIVPADFWKLRSVTLTYDLPPRFVPGARTAAISLAGRNLFVSTDYDGADPEVQDTRDSNFGIARREYYNLPPIRSFLATVRVSF